MVAWIASAAPVDSETIPGRKLPAPIAPTAWSIPPVITKVSVVSPSASAALEDESADAAAGGNDLGELLGPDPNDILDSISPPGVLLNIIIQGRAGNRTIRHDPACQAINQIILYKNEPGCPGKDFRLVLTQPQDFAGWPGGDDLGDAGARVNFRCETAGQEGSLFGGTVIQPDHGRIDCLASVVQCYGGLSLAGDSQSLDLPRLLAGLFQGGPHRFQASLPVDLRVKLGAFGGGRFKLVLLAAHAQAASIRCE